MNVLERLARALADDAPMTRRDAAARGLLGALALGSVGTLWHPHRALAHTGACGSLETCLDDAGAAAAKAFDKCMATYYHGPQWTEFSGLGCTLWAYRPTKEKGERACREKCPPPKNPYPPKKKSPTKQTKPPPPPPPPPLPPNPYNDVSAECANCGLVGGKCCYGPDPRSLCVCANPDYPCSRYGCDG